MPPDARPNKKKLSVDLDMLPGNAPRPKTRSRKVRMYATSEGDVEGITPDGSIRLLGGGFNVCAVGTNTGTSIDDVDTAIITGYADASDPRGAHAAGVVTVDADGTYLISASVSIADPAGAYAADLFLGGISEEVVMLDSREDGTLLAGCVQLRLAKGTQIELRGQHGSNAAKTFTPTTSNYFSVTRIA